jgi:hypothetical protein
MTERDLDQPGFDDVADFLAANGELPPEPTEEELARLREEHPEYFPGPECLPYARFLPCIERGGFTTDEMAHVMRCAYCFRTLNGLTRKMYSYVVVPAYVPQEEAAPVMLEWTRQVQACTDSAETVHGRCRVQCSPHPPHLARVEVSGCDGGFLVRVWFLKADNAFLEGVAGEKRIAMLARSQVKVLAALTYEDDQGCLPREAIGALKVTRDRDLLADIFLTAGPTRSVSRLALLLLPGPATEAAYAKGAKGRRPV